MDLLDRLTVRIVVGESRAHLPPIKLELVHFGSKPKKQTKSTQAKGTQSPLEEKVNIKAAVLAEQRKKEEKKPSVR